MNTSPARLVLIDGFSYFYRAFHALPPLLSAAGQPTGALYGVLNMLRATLKAKPEYAAFVIDAPGKSFRAALYPAYKANRPPMPDDLRAQVQPMCEMVQALGMEIVCVPEVEADDVIGTLALAAVNQGLDVTIATGDKDFAQLVRPGITLMDTQNNNRITSDHDVMQKFGVHAHQIVDFLALMGDKSDNVPGIAKCGEKTAAKWLAQYGNLDNVIANAGNIKGKVGENLRNALSRLPLNRELVTIRTNVELEKKPHELMLRVPDVNRLRQLYKEYGFAQALRELENNQTAPINSNNELNTSLRGTAAGYAKSASHSVAIDETDYGKGEYEIIVTDEQLDALVQRLQAANLFAFDTETDSLEAMRAHLVGLSFAVETGKAAYIPLSHDYPGAPVQLPLNQVLDKLRPLFLDTTKRKLAQNGKYDIQVLQRYGIIINGYSDDTLLQSFVLNSTATRHDLDSLAQRYLNYQTIKFEEVAGKGRKQIPFSQVGIDEASQYAAEDADITLRLHQKLVPQLAAEPNLETIYRDIEIPLVQVLARIETNGVCIDRAELKRQSTDLATRMLAAQKKAFDLAGYPFNLDSPKQLQALLFDELALPVLVKTPKGQPSTNEEALEAIAWQHELPRIILDYRRLNKLRNTYTDKLPEMVNPQTGRVHTHYHQSGAATGRLSSSEPNLQNIPIRSEDGRRIRQAFIAPPGRKIIACDYSQIELRIMAHLSEDPNLISAFEQGKDIHKATAAEVFATPLNAVTPEQRRAAKAINFGLMYGMGAFGLAKNLGIDRYQAQDYIVLYFSRYPLVRDFMESMRQQARENGYVQTLFGRRLYLNDINASQSGLRAGAERAAINAPMQGTAADIIKRAMITVDHWLSHYHSQAHMIMQVHDELVFEVDSEFVPIVCQEVQSRMIAAANLRVPLVVDTGIGDNWEQAH